MKKSILLLAAGLITGFTSNAQRVYQPHAEPTKLITSGGRFDGPIAPTTLPGARTTGVGNRWYSFGTEFLDMWQTSLGQFVSYTSTIMWNDTTALIGYTGTVTSPFAPYDHNQVLSVGMGLDPYASHWNYADGSGSTSYPYDYTGFMGMRPTDGYTVDSLYIVGWYDRSDITTPAKLAVVDTLIVALTQGNGGATSPIFTGTVTTSGLVTAYCPTCVTLPYSRIYHDTVNNRAGGVNGAPLTSVYKFLLNSSDTNVLAPKNAVFPRPGHGDPAISYPVTGGNVVAATVTFKSGDTNYHPRGVYSGGSHPGDTIRLSDGTTIGTQKYNTWSPQIQYAATASAGGSPAVFCSGCYMNMGKSSGHFSIEGGGWPYHSINYTANWGITTAGTSLAAHGFQFPRIAFHVACPTCPDLPIASLGVNDTKTESVATMPNPADKNLVLTYHGTFKSDAVATLTNVLGQVVATQQMVDGKAVFNTMDLASGHYIYTVTAKGDRATGRVVIAH
jgi:hypothetical protein